MTADAAREVFASLRELLLPYADDLAVVHDTPEQYYLDTAHVMPNGKPLFFAAAKIGKRYVSFHLMPVYVNSALLDGLSDDLRKRMQGKSCFNFRQIADVPRDELARLARAGYDDYRKRGYV